MAENIQHAQNLQKVSYAKRHPLADSIFKVGDKVLLKNLRREDRKGGWALMPWIGPYTIHTIVNNNLCVLKNGDKILKTKHLLKNIKQYHERQERRPRNSTSETSIDIEYVQTLQFPNQTRYFNPVGKHWQQAKCRALKLNFKQSLENGFKTKILNHPCAIHNIVGDGNCFFRAFSYAATGTEEQHLIIRQNIRKYKK